MRLAVEKAPFGIEIGVGEEGAELVAELEIGIAVGEGGVGDLGCVLGDG